VIQTAGLTHIHLAVRDLDAAVAFYKQVFGMEDQGISEEDMVFLRTPGASDTITLRKAGPDEEVGSGGGLDHFGFRLRNKSDLDAAIQEVTGAGGRLVERGEHAPGQHYAYVADRDGFLIEL
jgi:catechol 2,3-dioxygenase-like lactoylglutathione lyase family enzyme